MTDLEVHFQFDRQVESMLLLSRNWEKGVLVCFCLFPLGARDGSSIDT